MTNTNDPPVLSPLGETVRSLRHMLYVIALSGKMGASDDWAESHIAVPSLIDSLFAVAGALARRSLDSNRLEGLQDPDPRLETCLDCIHRRELQRDIDRG